MSNRLSKVIVREGLMMLIFLGGGILLLYMDFSRSRYTEINTGVASVFYLPTFMGGCGILLLFTYLVYLIFRLITVIKSKML